MHRNPLFPAIAASACVVLCPALDYVGGRMGHPLAIFLFPAQIAPVFGMLSFGIWALILIISSAYLRRQYVYPFLAIATVAASAIGTIRVLPHLLPASPFVLGLHARIFSQVTPEQLRLIAAKTSALLVDRGSLPSPGKWSLWDPESDGPLWAKMSEAPGLKNLEPWHAPLLKRQEPRNRMGRSISWTLGDTHLLAKC